ncbi:cyanophycin synthetase [Clostridium botulinum]|nr:cyanophycin synthetase [Clostridium botulinum]
MKVVQERIYEGKNIYSHKKCIRMDVDLQGYCETPSKDIPNFNFNLLKLVPELYTHRCGIDEDGGFVTRLKEGTYLAHICEHITIALQNRLGIEVAYGKAREIQGDRYYIIFQYEYAKTAMECFRLSMDLINALITQSPINFEERINSIKEILNSDEIGPSTNAICKAAKEYNMPITQLGNSGFYQIGYGKQGKVIEAAISEKTSCVAVDISCDKFLTKQLLANQNIPVALGEKVYNIIDLLKCAEKIEYPVVLKPQYGSKGNGIYLNIKNENELIKSYNNLKNKFKDILIEKYIEGNDYRVCVVDYKVVAVSLRIPPFVIGNGKGTLKELIENINKDPLRGEDHEKPLTKIKIDDQLISYVNKKNLSLSYIPKDNEKVFLRENANISTGGIAIDCTDNICEENINHCINAAKALGLDICGIDLCVDDISYDIAKSNGVIMEVNAAPGIRMHHFPSKGIERNVGKAIINMMYGENPKNIPIVSVTGTNGKTTTTRLINHVLSQMGYSVGMTSTEGIYVNNKCIHKGDDSGFNSAKTILLNRDVDIAVLETARGGLIRKGLAYDIADVSVITNITNDHLGLDGINSMEELSFVKALVGEAVKENGFTILNADDEWSKTIINRIKANKIFFSKYADNELIQKNIIDGGISVFIENDNIIVVNNHKKYSICSINDVPLSYNGLLKYNLENIMAACGALVGMNIDYCMISKGIMSFNLNNNNGRFNIYEIEDRKIILDYGHNIEGYKAVLSSLDKIKKDKDLIGVIGIPGDRCDDIAIEIGEICSEMLDKIIIKEDKDRRGRDEGEIASLLKNGVLRKNKNAKIHVCLDEIKALEKALMISKKGDTIVVFFEDLESIVKYINNKNSNNSLNLKLSSL